MIDQRNRQVTILGALKDFCTGVADYKGYTTVAGYWKPMIVIIPVILILFFMFLLHYLIVLLLQVESQ